MKNNLIWLLIVAVGAWLGIEFAASSFGDWIFYVAGVVIAGLLLWTQRQVKQQREIIALLSDRCDPDAFLKAYEAEMAQVKDPGQLDMLRINQAAGVCYAGDFDKALKILRAIDIDSLKGIYQAHYYNNLVSVLILADRDKEALRMYSRGKELLEMPVKNKELAVAIMGTRASIAFLKGELAEAEKLFAELLAKSPAPLLDAASHLFLGRIAKAKGRQEEGAVHFRQAASLGGKSVITRLAEKDLSN